MTKFSFCDKKSHFSQRRNGMVKQNLYSPKFVYWYQNLIDINCERGLNLFFYGGTQPNTFTLKLMLKHAIQKSCVTRKKH